MLPTLGFSSKALEAAYLSHSAPRRARVAVHFAVFRLVVLVFTAVRALLAARRLGREALLLLLGAATNVLPMLAAVLSPRSHGAWLARWGALGTEIVQAAIGVTTHHCMAPSHTGGQPTAAVVYLPYGSTALWLLCYAAFSMLPFHMLLLQQSLVAMVLLAGSRSMCQESAGLRIGYAALHTLLQRAQQAARDWRLPLIPGWPALASAFSFAPGGLVCPAASSAEEPCTAESSIAAACGADGTPSSLVRLCIDHQVPVLLGSFALSTWLAYRAELRSRLAWLTHTRHSTFSDTATASRGSASGSGDRSDSGSAQPAAAPDASAVALRQAVDFELIGPLPNDAVYWLQLALPCMLCIGIVARAVM